MKIQFRGKVFEVMEPEIINEAWNTYDLKDGSRIKTRTIMTKLLWPKGIRFTKGVEIDIRASFKNIVAVFAPEKLRGPPNPTPPPVSIAQTKDMKEVQIKNSKEEWNIYGFPSKKIEIKFKMVVSSIFRVSKLFNDDGDPYYIVNSSNVVGIRYKNK